MITEDYVSFEVAKLLKEKGFKGIGSFFYDEEGTFVDFNNYWRNLTPTERYKAIEAPTHQMVLKWLREVHNLHMIVIPYAPMNRNPHHPGEADIVYITQLFKGIIPIDEVGRSIIKLTYKEAIEAGIKYCLVNLIEDEN